MTAGEGAAAPEFIVRFRCFGLGTVVRADT